jgi:hypothetical protein
MALNKNRETTKTFLLIFHSDFQIGVGNAVNLNNFDTRHKKLNSPSKLDCLNIHDLSLTDIKQYSFDGDDLNRSNPVNLVIRGQGEKKGGSGLRLHPLCRSRRQRFCNMSPNWE